MLQHLDRCVEEGFLRAEYRSTLIEVERPEEVVDALGAFVPPARPTWVTRPRP